MLSNPMTIRAVVWPLLNCNIQVENNAFCRAALSARMGDHLLDRAPLVSDVETFTPDAAMAAACDGIIGGFPCQVS